MKSVGTLTCETAFAHVVKKAGLPDQFESSATSQTAKTCRNFILTT